MNKTMKRIGCLALALVMLLSLAACGKGNAPSGASGSGSGAPSGSGGGKAPEATPAPEYVYAAEFKPLVEKTKEWIYARSYTGDGLYFTKYEKTGEREHGDQIPRWEGEFDVYSTFLYFLDNKGKISKVEAYSCMPPAVDDQGRREFSSASDLLGICFTDDGFVTVEVVYNSWSEGDGTEALYSEDYWNSQRSEQLYYIRWFDKQGNELSCAPIEVAQDGWLDAYKMTLDDKGNVLVGESQQLRAIGPDGRDAYTIKTEGSIDGVVRMPDGRVAAVIYGDQQMLCFLDSDSGKFKDGVAVNFDTYNAVPGSGEYDFYYTNGANFYGYKLDGGEQKLFNWINCDINSLNATVLGVDADGTVHCLINTWNQKDQSYSYELADVRLVPYDSVPHKESIRMAVLYIDYRVQDMVVNYNRKNDKYRIEITDYSEYNNDKDGWDAGQTKLRTEILSGNVPDIFCLNGLNYTQLAAKGILEDLYPYMDADKDMKRSDFFQNVLQAFEVNGKLCQTVAGFYINSAIGGASVVGDKPGWTYEQFNEALASMPDGCTAFDQYVTRDNILQTCLALDMNDFVDWTSGKVSFDSEQFIKLLKFANSFPSDFDWENYDWSQEMSTEDRLAQGRQMLVQTSAYSIEDIFYNNYTQFLGGKITYIGYPTAHGTGNMISLSEAGYGMSSKSPYKDEIWKFLRSFFTKDYQTDVYSLPSRIDVFEEKALDAETVQYQKNEDGNYVLDDKGEKIPVSRYTMWDAAENKTREIYALEPEQVDQIRELVESTTKVADYNQEILDIVTEQAAPYFAGQKSAEEVAKLVQSKANIYVNEQR
ncbi:MAG: extracellular solute-binding protein [Oscillospiraceae bacterium]|nr:extracellular solute-binding protein [Oscillospiraceae bacterium]